MLLNKHFTALVLSLSISPFALGVDSVQDTKCECTRTTNPTPTLPFTLAAFQSPYPPYSNASGSYGVSGVKVRAYLGNLYVNRADEKPKTSCASLRGEKCPAGNETVLWVDESGRAWLDSSNPQPVYLNTRTGALSYLPSSTRIFPPGANAVNFLHLGDGTSTTSPLPFGNPPDYVNAGPGSFQWKGSSNDYWVLCPKSGLGYLVMKFVGGTGDWASCLFGIQMVAVDYAGKSPAAGEYL